MNNTDKPVPSPFPAPTPQVAAPATPEVTGTPTQTTQNAEKKPEVQKPKYKITTPEEYFGPKGLYKQTVARYSSFKNRRTGFADLDKVQPFFPGLYCLGAISSLGKTTFAHQLADQLAAMGQPVLYFSLEQTKDELYNKSLAREFFLERERRMKASTAPVVYPTPSSMDLRCGEGADEAEIDARAQAYRTKVSGNLCVVESIFDMTVETIIEMVESTIKGGIRPVVIIDYLQIITPTLINQRVPDSKTSVDHIVHALKMLQAKNDLTIIAISSVNRANYTTTIDFESFKESGGIEYTADVIWGLQLSILGDPRYKNEKNVNNQREMIRKEKAMSPRSIDLVCLKNRYGKSSYTVSFDYYPASDVFCPGKAKHP